MSKFDEKCEIIDNKKQLKQWIFDVANEMSLATIYVISQQYSAIESTRTFFVR